jgi:hypothetical protein
VVLDVAFAVAGMFEIAAVAVVDVAFAWFDYLRFVGVIASVIADFLFQFLNWNYPFLVLLLN